MRRLKLWYQWQKRCVNPWYHKLLVLLGIVKSPTFEMNLGFYYAMEE